MRVILFFGLLAAVAAADVVRYDYASHDFTQHVNLFPAADRFTGYIEVDDADLGGTVANRSFNSFNVPVQWYFTDGSLAFHNANAGVPDLQRQPGRRPELHQRRLRPERVLRRCRPPGPATRRFRR